MEKIISACHLIGAYDAAIKILPKSTLFRAEQNLTKIVEHIVLVKVTATTGGKWNWSDRCDSVIRQA